MNRDAAGVHRSRLILCLGIVYLVWGSSYLATRIGVLRLPPLMFGGIRFFIAGVLLVLVAAWWARRTAPGVPRASLRRLPRREWAQLGVMALFGIAICNGLNAWALQFVSSGESSLINASNAFWIAGLGMLGPRAHRPSTRVVLGLAIGFAGTLMVVWPEGHAADAPAADLTIPRLATLAACLSWSAATIYLRSTHYTLDLLTLTGAPMILGGASLALCGLALGEGPRWHYDPGGLVAMAWLAVSSSCIAYTAYAWLAKNATPAQAGTYGYVNPALAVLLGWLVLDEHMVGAQLAGMGVILAGVLLVNWPERAATGQPAG